MHDVSEEQRVVASTRLIAGLTLLSRILGLARECVYARFFGTGVLLSAFRIAFMIPNLARRLFGEGALSAAFIPVFTRALRDPDPQHARRLAGAVLTMLAAVLVGLLLTVELGLLVAHALRPGLTLRLTAIMLPFMAFICVAAYLGGLLNVLGRFAAPAASPMLLNTLVIAAVLLGAHVMGWSGQSLIYAACGGVLAAGVAQVCLLIASLRATGFRPAVNRHWSHPDVRAVTRSMMPMMIGLSAVQLNTMADMLIAKFFVPDGRGPAVLGYAHFIYQLPLGVFGVALATAIFPLLASRAAADDGVGLSDAVMRGVRLSLFVMLPASVGLILIAEPLVVLLFEGGAFDAAGTPRVSRTLVFYALGLCAYAVQHILVRTFYAVRAHRTPARVAAAAVGVNLALNLILVGPLRESGVALATAISATLQVGCLTFLLRRRLPELRLRPVGAGLVRSAVATIAMALCVGWLIGPAAPCAALHLSALEQVLLAVPLGCGVMAGVSRWLRAPELTELLRRR